MHSLGPYTTSLKGGQPSFTVCRSCKGYYGRHHFDLLSLFEGACVT